MAASNVRANSCTNICSRTIHHSDRGSGLRGYISLSISCLAARESLDRIIITKQRPLNARLSPRADIFPSFCTEPHSAISIFERSAEELDASRARLRPFRIVWHPGGRSRLRRRSNKCRSVHVIDVTWLREVCSETASPNQNAFTSWGQTLCHFFNEGPTLNDLTVM